MNKVYLLCVLFFPFFVFGQEDLQSLIDEADQEITLEANNVYEVNEPIIMPSNFKIEGNNSVIRPSANWRKRNPQNSPLIIIESCSGLELSNLTIDNMADRGIVGMPAYSLLILNSSDISISSVTFQNLGLHKSDKNVGGFPFILMLAQEETGDFSYLPEKYKAVKGSVENVSVRDCKFLNTDYVNSFAIRMLTPWNKGRDKTSIKYLVKNVLLQGNVFVGEYDWNTVEMAGPGTKDIKIYANYLKGKSINNIDVDKGASDIEIRNNIITDAGLPHRHRNNKNVRVSPIMVHGSTTSYICENVSVGGNEITNVTNPVANNSRYLYSSGIGVAHAKNVTVFGNTVKGLFPGKNYGAAICLDQAVELVTINDNIIEDVNWGVIITPNTSSFREVEILNNKVRSRSESLLLLNGSSGKFSGLTLKGNEVRSDKEVRVKMGAKIEKISSDIKY